MKIIRFGILPLLIAAYAVSQTPSAEKKSPSGSDRERLIGAWHLASISGPDGKPVTTGVPVGMLVYTRDGHMSVQLSTPNLQVPCPTSTSRAGTRLPSGATT